MLRTVRSCLLPRWRLYGVLSAAVLAYCEARRVSSGLAGPFSLRIQSSSVRHCQICASLPMRQPAAHSWLEGTPRPPQPPSSVHSPASVCDGADGSAHSEARPQVTAQRSSPTQRCSPTQRLHFAQTLHRRLLVGQPAPRSFLEMAVQVVAARTARRSRRASAELAVLRRLRCCCSMT